MVYIAYFTKLNLQICDYAKKDAFVAKIVNTRLTKIFMAIFAPDERLPSSATLLNIQTVLSFLAINFNTSQFCHLSLSWRASERISA